jgi:hypothetical protein
MEYLKRVGAATLARIVWQAMLNLRWVVQSMLILTGEAMDEEDAVIEKAQSSKDIVPWH